MDELEHVQVKKKRHCLMVILKRCDVGFKVC